MAAKKVSIPHPRAVASPDDWVNQKPAPAATEAMKRLTVDIPESLHTRIKIGCAASHLKMSDAVRALLDAQWPAKTSTAA